MQVSNNQKTGLLVIFIITAGVILYLMSSFGALSLPSLEKEGVVATVNGEKILNNEFEDYSAQVLAQSSPGQEPDNNQIIEGLINEKLIIQEAARRGIEVSDAEINAEYDMLALQFGSEDDFKTVIEQEGITTDYLKKLIYRSLIVERYGDLIIEENDISASEEEIKAFYDEVATFQDDLPALDENVREQIEEQLVNDMLMSVMDGILQNLRAEAEIEIFI